MAHLITASAGQPHITPKDDASWHRGTFEVQSAILPFGSALKPETIPASPSNVRIKNGIGMLQGRFFRVDAYDVVTIPNGAQNQNRIDIICAKITQNEDGTQSFDWEVVSGNPTSGTPAAPTITAHSLDDGDEFALMPVVKVRLTGVNITSVERAVQVLWTGAHVNFKVTAGSVTWQCTGYLDGRIEMRGRASTSVAITTPNGGIYSSASDYAVAMPSSPRVSIESFSAEMDGVGWVVATQPRDPRIKFYAPTAQAVGARDIYYYIVGKWDPDLFFDPAFNPEDIF